MHSLLFLLIITFFLFIHVPSSVSEADKRYTGCSRFFNCGKLNEVGYPFWGNGRPGYCGHPALKLDCEDDQAIIQIHSEEYRVMEISPDNQFLKIVQKDLFRSSCPQQFVNTTLDYTLFQYTPHDETVTLFYSCASSVVLGSLKQFTCDVNGRGPLVGYFALGEAKELRLICNVSVNVPVLRSAITDLLESSASVIEVLSRGFELQVMVEWDQCRECFKSGGMCGYNSTESNCFCRDQPHTRSCRTPPVVTSPPPASSLMPTVKTPSPGRTVLGRKFIIGLSGVAGIAIIVAFIFSFRYLRSFRKKAIENKNVEEFLRNYGSITPKRYSYSDIKLMTNSFKGKLGQGGYGSVYKGKLHDGRPVAVKFLKELKGNGEEFINEVASISRTSHVNIVNLLGFCFDGHKRALIYEFMPNGSLEKFIYDEKPLTSDRRLGWETLHQIATGIARGLEYLHRGCNTRILHFDIKPHNILLDEEFCPKISDFGLAKLCTRKESAVSMLAARGTIGYIAPEVFSRQFGHVSHKSDVYSYGMMVLEMVGVRNNTGQATGNTSDEYFPHWIYRHINLSGHLALHGISTEKDDEIARKMVLVGLWCIQTNPSDRPSISKVLEMLEGDLESLPIPPKPFLSSPPRSPASSPTRSTSSKQSTVL